ncbi:unnamed protein product [Rotaria socialis]
MESGSSIPVVNSRNFPIDSGQLPVLSRRNRQEIIEKNCENFPPEYGDFSGSFRPVSTVSGDWNNRHGYKIIECGYLFQSSSSKQWIENIRTTKEHFNILLAQSKMKLLEVINDETNDENDLKQISESTSPCLLLRRPYISIRGKKQQQPDII